MIPFSSIEDSIVSGYLSTVYRDGYHSSYITIDVSNYKNCMVTSMTGGATLLLNDAAAVLNNVVDISNQTTLKIGSPSPSENNYAGINVVNFTLRLYN